MAEAATESGLCSWLGEQLTALEVLPHLVILLLIAMFITMLTEVCSNGAVAPIMLPVMAQLVSGVGGCSVPSAVQQFLMCINDKAKMRSCAFVISLNFPYDSCHVFGFSLCARPCRFT